MKPETILRDFFGFDSFRPGQEEIINSILAGEDLLAVLPTGGGKSICYQIPALLSGQFSIVISPLIALMKDQVDSLNSRQIVSGFINSTLDFRESNKVLDEISSGRIKLLYLSPEKLGSVQFCEKLKSLSPFYLFVDEAHCISEWGHSFRPSYRRIKSFKDQIGFRNVAAFTATATEDVRNDIIEQLGLNNPKIFVKGFERENLKLNVIRSGSKKEKVLELLKRSELPAIIYTATRKSAEELADYLRLSNTDSVFYHAGIAPELRRIIQDDFQKERIKLIIATNAFGMGIDKSNIRTLIHYNLPGNVESYYQEIGRAGRDGKISNVYLLYDDNDRQIQEFFIRNSFPTREQIETVYTAICDYAPVAFGNRYEKEIPIDKNLTSFLESKGITKGLMESTLKILTDSDYITNVSRDLKHYVRLTVDPSRIKNYLNALEENDVKDLLLILIREYGSSIFHSRTPVNPEKISQMMGESAVQNSELLRSLNLSGLITYESPSNFPGIKLRSERIKSEDLVLNYGRTRQLIEQSRSKLEMMIGYVFSDGCRFDYLLKYFGQNIGIYKCGHCDNCTGIPGGSQPVVDFIEDRIIETLRSLNSPVRVTELINTLIGKGNVRLPGNIETLGSCSHYSKKEIEKSLSILKENKKILVRKNVCELADSDLETSDAITTNEGYELELKLFNLLRQIRKEAVSKFGQPPHIICPDEVLREISRKRPSTFSQLLEIPGFNQRMFNKIGEEILSVIEENKSESNLSKLVKQKKLPDNIVTIHELLKKKYPVEDIIKLTGLSETLVSIQIETLIGYFPELETDYLFNANELNEVKGKIKEGITDLKPLYESLNKQIGYPKLRIILASVKSNQ